MSQQGLRTKIRVSHAERMRFDHGCTGKVTGSEASVGIRRARDFFVWRFAHRNEVIEE
jgi:hypothetical protein